MGGAPPASAPARHRARARRSSLPLVAGLLLAASSAHAQQQPVLLELRPRAGDTLHVRVDQEVEMTGTRRVGGADSTMTVVTTMQVRTRCVVERADAAGSTILATTDSVRISSTGEHARETERARRALQGRTVRLQIAPDGSARVVDDGAASTPGDLPAVFAQMPATLPRRAVAVGESWTRQIAIPRAGAASGVGTLRATFRLDSLSRGGDLAYVSMRGSLARDAAGGRADGGGRGGSDSSRLEMVGVVSGGMTIDRRRGWMTDARTTLSVRSRVPPSPDDRSGTPMVVRLKMTQWLRTY